MSINFSHLNEFKKDTDTYHPPFDKIQKQGATITSKV